MRDSTFPHVLEDCLKLSMVGDLHVVEFHLWPSDLDVLPLAPVPWRWPSLKVHLSVPVSWCWKIECHVVASLENTLINFGWCFASVSCRWMKHNSDPLLDSPENSDHSNLHSGRFLDNKFIGSRFCHWVLSWGPLGHDTLLSVWKKNGCKKTSRNSWYSTNTGYGPTHQVWSFLWLTCLRVGFWCQHIRFGSSVPKLTLSNNQSSAFLWVLDTCLIVGLRPLIVIFGVSGYAFHNRQLINLLFSFVSWCFCFGVLSCTGFHDAIMAWFDSVVSWT